MAHLELHQRYEIYHLQKQGNSFTEIAQSKYNQRQANKPKSIRLTQEIRDFIKEDKYQIELI